MAFRKRNAEGSDEVLASYDVVYRGGLAHLPKAKVGKIELQVQEDVFFLKPTTSSKKYWADLVIPYTCIATVEVVERNVSTFEAMAGGLNSRQLNQKNNLHISYHDEAGKLQLRLEMLSGVTVMGQAKKCAEFEDRLRTLRIYEKFQGTASGPTATEPTGLGDELSRLAELRSSGVLTEEEFAAAKARLLGLS